MIERETKRREKERGGDGERERWMDWGRGQGWGGRENERVEREGDKEIGEYGRRDRWRKGMIER